MKFFSLLVAMMLMLISSAASATDFGFSQSGLQSRVNQLNAQVQTIQLQHQAKLARQVQFLQQQQLVAANTVNVHAQLGQLRALQQAQALQALHLNGLVNQNPLLSSSIVHQQPIIQQQVVHQQPIIQQRVIHQQPIIQQQVVRQRVCAPQQGLRFRSCR